LCVVASRGLVLHQLDVQSAFLHDTINCEVFDALPSFVFSCEIRSSKVGKLRRSVYGQKQSQLIWSQHFTASVGVIGFRRMDQEPSLYTRILHGCLKILAVYVDDIPVASSQVSEEEEMKKLLSKTFDITDMVVASIIMG
jgi:Reverse transcriptase (RNA-dependent DNA polymerase)